MYTKLLTSDLERIRSAHSEVAGEYGLSFLERPQQVNAGLVTGHSGSLRISYLWFGTAALLNTERPRRRAYCFSTCLRGGGHLHQGGVEQAWRKDLTLPLHSVHGLRLAMNSAFKVRNVCIDTAALNDFYERWSGHPLEREELDFDLRPFDDGLRVRWAQALQLLEPSSESGELPPLARATLNEYLMALLLESHPHDGRATFDRPAPSRVVRDAIRYIDNNARHALTVGDVARACGCSIRSLQIGFKNDLGSTPRIYLAEVRMGLAKLELERSERGVSVADVAYDLGFRHLGRFSSEFRSRFGEYPSHVLRRNRSRNHKLPDRS